MNPQDLGTRLSIKGYDHLFVGGFVKGSHRGNDPLERPSSGSLQWGIRCIKRGRERVNYDVLGGRDGDEQKVSIVPCVLNRSICPGLIHLLNLRR